MNDHDYHEGVLYGPLDDGGRFEIRGYPWDRVSLAARRPGGSWTYLIDAPVVDEFVIRLESTPVAGQVKTRLSGEPFLLRVTDESDSPIRYAEVYVNDEIEGYTDPDGELPLRWSTNGPTYLAVHHPAYARVHRDIVGDRAPPDSVILIRMQSLVPVQVQVTVRSGEPKFEKWKIALFNEDGGESAQTMLDPKGHATLLVGLGKPSIFVNDQLGWRLSYKIDGEDPLSLKITPATESLHIQADWQASPVVLRAHGRVTDKGRPALGVKISVKTVSMPYPETRLSESGSFDFGQVTAAEIPGIGKLSFVVSDPAIGWSRHELWSRSMPASRESFPLNLDLRSGSLSGVVIDSVGRPVPRIVVEVEGVLTTASGDFAGLDTKTNLQGQFSLDRLVAGTYRLSVDSEGLGGSAEGVLVGAGGSTGPLMLRVTTRSKLRGRVFLDELDLWDVREPTVELIGPIQKKARCEAGFFEISQLVPGTYRAVLDLAPYNYGHKRLVLVHPLEIRVPSEEEHIELRFNATHLDALREQAKAMGFENLAACLREAGLSRDKRSGKVWVHGYIDLRDLGIDGADRIWIRFSGPTTTEFYCEGRNFRCEELVPGSYKVAVSLNRYSADEGPVLEFRKTLVVERTTETGIRIAFDASYLGQLRQRARQQGYLSLAAYLAAYKLGIVPHKAK